MAQKKVKGVRLDRNNIFDYIQETYGPQCCVCLKAKTVSNYTPLLQNDFGGKNDCSLTCITALLTQNKNPQTIYSQVEKVAKKYFFDGKKIGTIPFFIKAIIDNVGHVNSKQGYGKNVGFNWTKIKSLIDQNKPIILSVNNDGRNYYKNHSVTIVGYKEYLGGVKILSVYDNWKKTIAYIDFNKLSVISSINYL